MHISQQGKNDASAGRETLKARILSGMINQSGEGALKSASSVQMAASGGTCVADFGRLTN